jgi:hypothetical protein
LGFLHERVDNLVLARVGLRGLAERVDAGFEFFGVEEVLGAVEQAVEGVFVALEGLLAIFLGLFTV